MTHRDPHARSRRGWPADAAMAVVASATLAGVSASLALYRIGRDNPAQYAERVQAIRRRFADGHPQGAVVLTGSSYMEFWTTSARDLAPLETVNIGIGGTKIGDHVAYLDEMVVPFAPRALVVYAGSNDINAIPFLSKAGGDVADRALGYVDAVHRRLPGLPIHYVAITEAPIRSRVRAEIRKANDRIKAAAEARDDLWFIDTAAALLTGDGHIDATLFRQDRLHLNDAGYQIFASVIRKHLHAFASP